MNFYLISQITSEHLTSNSKMWHVTTPCCVPEHSSALPWALDSVHHNSENQPSCHSSNLLRYIRSLDWAKIISLISAAASTTPLQNLPPPLPLLLLLDVPFPDVEADPMLPCLCPPRGLQMFTRKWPLTFTLKSVISQRACECTIDFLRKSPHLSRRAHEWPLTFTLKSLTSQRAFKCTVTFTLKSLTSQTC